jgi:hypothetical protein
MSNTPRTDEVTLGEFEYGRDYDGNYQVAALDYEVLRDLARQLERDRARLVEALRSVLGNCSLTGEIPARALLRELGED